MSMIPADDRSRNLTLANPEASGAEHLGLVGDTYTVLLSGKDTAGQYCLIDMFVPPGGGPPPHRHDFEETFVVLEGEIATVFRGQKGVARAGDTLHIPANAPHQFHNASDKAARLLCTCSPAGQEDFFREVAVKVGGRTEAPPKLDEAGEKALREKSMALAGKYKTEFLPRA